MVRSHAEWEMIIKEAYASELPLKRWCREHDINYDTFKCAKRKLLENGKLQFMDEKICWRTENCSSWMKRSDYHKQKALALCICLLKIAGPLSY